MNNICKLFSVITVLLVSNVFVTNMFGQEDIKTVTILQTEVAPVIDGEIDDLWDYVPAQETDRLWPNQSVSMIGNAAPTWKAIWDSVNFYVLVEVPDDHCYTHEEAGVESWLADKPELYFDVNEDKVGDSPTGPSTSGSGHYQFAPDFSCMDNNVPANFDVAFTIDDNDQNYIFEYAIPFSVLGDEDGNILNPFIRTTIGFDVTVLDLDDPAVGLNSDIGRVNWSNDMLTAGESWVDMDMSGDLTFSTEGITPDIEVASTYSFGDVPESGAVTYSLPVNNKSLGVLEISSISLNNTDFSVSINELTVAPMSNSVIPIQFKPTAIQAYTGILTLITNDPDEGTVNIALSGIGVAQPEIEVSPTTFTENLVSGNVSTKTFTISNTGPGVLKWTTNLSEFPEWLILSDSSGQIASSTSSTIDLTFNATKTYAGSYTFSLKIQSNDIDEPEIPISLQLTVTGENEIDCPNTFSFGNALVNNTKTLKYIIKNIGTDVLNISSISVDNSVFVIGATSSIINAKETDTIDFSFTPSSSGYFSGNLTIISDDADEGTLVIPVSGSGVGPAGISVTPSPLVSSYTGCSGYSTANLTIENIGEADLHASVNAVSSSEEYVMMTSDDVGGPIYEWYDISSIGTLTGLSGDDSYKSISLPFAFPFYDYTYTTAFVSTNGLITFGSSSVSYSNSTLPNLGTPNNLIALFWDDLNGVGQSYTYYDESNKRFIIQFNNWTKLGSSYKITFQAQLYENGEIVLNYHDLNGSLTSATVGIENSNGSKGIQAACNETFLKSNFSVKFAKPVNWIKIPDNSVVVTQGNSEDVEIRFIADSLTEGIYEMNLSVSSNDPNNPTLTVPCVFELTGVPEIEILETSLAFGEVFKQVTTSLIVDIENLGCGALDITNISSDNGAFYVIDNSFNIAPGNRYPLEVVFEPQSALTYSGTLTIESDDADEPSIGISLSGQGVEPPIINVTPDSLFSISQCGNKSSTQLVVSNSGNSNLEYSFNANNSGSFEILVLRTGVNSNGEYSNTLNAINNYFTDYMVSEVNTTNAKVLEDSLVGKNVLLLPKKEFGSASVFSDFAPVLQKFVERGGSVIFCGSNYENAQHIFNTGLFNGSYRQRNNYEFVSKLKEHEITANVNSSFYAYSYIYGIEITNNDAQILATYNANAIVAYREIGLGRAIYIGFDFNNYSSDQSRIIANTVKWAGYKAVPSWLNLSLSADTVLPGNNTSVKIEFDAKNLSAGVYTAELLVNSNDPVNDEVKIPCRYEVIGNSDFYVASSSINFGSVMVGSSASRSITVYNYGCGDLNITDISTDNNIFTENYNSWNILPGQSKSFTVYFNPDSALTYYGNLIFSTNDPNNRTVNIQLIGSTIERPEIYTSIDSLDFGNIILGDSVEFSYVLSAKNLTNYVNLYNSKFMYSLDGINYSSSLYIYPTNGVINDTLIRVKAYPSYVSNVNTYIYHNSSNAQTKSVSAKYNCVNPPYISLTESEINFNNVLKGQVAVQNYSLNALNLWEPLQICAPNGFQVSAYPDSAFSDTLIIQPFNGSLNNELVYVRFGPTSDTSYTGKIVHNSYRLPKTDVKVAGQGVRANVLSVSTYKSSGYYKAGEVIDMELNYSQNVTVDTLSGKPYIKLNTVPENYAYYVGGSGTKTLVFNYTVGSSDSVSALDYYAVDNLVLNGAKILYQSHNAETVLPNVGSFSEMYTLVIDNSKPKTMLIGKTGLTNEFTNNIELTFNESILGFDISDLEPINASISSLKSLENLKHFAFSIEPNNADTFGVVMPQGRVIDFAGNFNKGSDTIIMILDTLKPQLSIQSNLGASITNEKIIQMSLVCSEDIDGLDSSVFVSSNCKISSFSKNDSLNLYNFSVEPITNGEVSLYVSENILIDKAGNSNTASNYISFIFDATAPTVEISKTVGERVNQSFNINVSFSESINDFSIDNLVGVNANLSNFTTLNDKKQYSLTVTPVNEDSVKVFLPFNAVTDSAGNGNFVSDTIVCYFDATEPVVSLSTSVPKITNSDSVNVILEFSEPLGIFSLDSLTVGNATVSNLKVIENGLKYSFVVNTTNEGMVFVKLNANKVFDAAGNGNKASNIIKYYYDASSPQVNISSNYNKYISTDTLLVLAQFSEPVIGFDTTGFVMQNCESYAVTQVSDSSFSLILTAINEGDLTVMLGANVATDSSGNTNSASNTLKFIYDKTLPIASMVTETGVKRFNEPFNILIEFSEPVANFDTTMLITENVGIGKVQELSENVKYLLEILPKNCGAVKIKIPNNVFADLTGNRNNDSLLLELTYDNEIPEIKVLELQNVYNNEAHINLVLSENCKVYYILQKANGPTPSADRLINGVGGEASGTLDMIIQLDSLITFGGLNQNEAYNLFAIAIDGYDNLSDVYNLSFSTTNVGIAFDRSVGYQLYPNPNNGSFYINIDNKELLGKEFEIKDVTGHVVKTMQIFESNKKVVIHNLVQGIYFVSIKNANNMYVKRFVVK